MRVEGLNEFQSRIWHEDTGPRSGFRVLDMDDDFILFQHPKVSSMPVSVVFDRNGDKSVSVYEAVEAPEDNNGEDNDPAPVLVGKFPYKYPHRFDRRGGSFYGNRALVDYFRRGRTLYNAGIRTLLNFQSERMHDDPCGWSVYLLVSAGYWSHVPHWKSWR